MKRVEAYHILHDMWKDADEKQREAIDIAQNDIEFVDLMPNEIIAQFNYGTKTNADHIHGMSDEELGEFLEKAEWICHYNTFCETCLKHGADGNCIHMTEWLKQPYKENEE